MTVVINIFHSLLQAQYMCRKWSKEFISVTSIRSIIWKTTECSWKLSSFMCKVLFLFLASYCAGRSTRLNSPIWCFALNNELIAFLVRSQAQNRWFSFPIHSSKTTAHFSVSATFYGFNSNDWISLIQIYWCRHIIKNKKQFITLFFRITFARLQKHSKIYRHFCALTRN